MRLLDASLPAAAEHLAVRYRSIARDYQDQANGLSNAVRAAAFSACARSAARTSRRYQVLAQALTTLGPAELAQLVRRVEAAPAAEGLSQLIQDLVVRAPLAGPTA